jgi:hypothetical protein
MTTRVTSRRAAKDALFDGFATIARRSPRDAGPRSSSCSPRASGPSTRSPGRSASRWPTPRTTCARSPVPGWSPADAPAPTSTTGSPHDGAGRCGSIRGLAAERVDEFDTLADAYLGDRDELETITRDELGAARSEATSCSSTSVPSGVRRRPHPRRDLDPARPARPAPRRPPRRGRGRRLLPRPVLRLRRRRRPPPARRGGAPHGSRTGSPSGGPPGAPSRPAPWT